MRLKSLLFVFVALVISSFAAAQTVQDPTVTAAIHQKYDHTQTYPGFDTVVLPGTPTIILSSSSFLPVSHFNGYYNVEQIPYSPVDTNFGCTADSSITPGMSQWLLSSFDDDRFDSVFQLPFLFYFFGLPKTSFVPGGNGMITFNQSAAGQACPWSTDNSYQLPWSGNCSFVNNAYMHDAIFGVYEDIHPIPSYNSTPQGLYYGVIGEFPSRKIIFSTKEITQYNASSNIHNRCTYQIVCYEATNVIEVHVKQRSLSSMGWNGNRGYIGIINATGQPQQPSDSIPWIQPGAPAAFYPEGYNPTTQAFSNTSFRFSPQGGSSVNSVWYRIFDDGRESVRLTTDMMDTNGYVVLEMGDDMTNPSLTRISVSPTCHSRYVHMFGFMDADSNQYQLFDTIRVGCFNAEFDTIISDTTITHDTAWVRTNYIVYDTLYVHDTVPVYIYDTIFIHDTVYVGVNDVQMVNVKMYASDGQIVVEGSEGMTVTLYDAVGRLLATRNDGLSLQRFNVPTSGTYMVKVGKYPARRVVVVK